MKTTFLLFLSLLFFTCKQTPKPTKTEIHFETMGTFGTVKIVSDSIINEEQIIKDIDSIFIDFNLVFSTYIDNSVISKYNRGEVNISVGSEFEKLKIKSLEFKDQTNGAFNPAILPLLNYWFEKKLDVIDSLYIDSLVTFINTLQRVDTILVTDSINLLKKEFLNFEPLLAMDFSAFAKGYGVDVLAHYLDNSGFTDYMVEIGGEVNCKGKNQDEKFWQLGIEEPNEKARKIYEVVKLQNKAMATSGNYRNFKILDNGQKIVHIINPKTGYPEISNLLSVSIVANHCMDADAYATACMVMGVDSCYQFVLNHPELDCYLIYSDDNGNLQSIYTDGFGKMIVK